MTAKRRRPKRNTGRKLGKAQVEEPKKPTSWTVPTVLGLLLSVVGAVGIIELRPQLAVTPLQELSTNAPFSAPFEVTNTGYLDLHINYITAIYHRVEEVHSGSRLSVKDSSQGSKDWDDFALERGGGTKTINLNLSNGMPIRADIVIAVDYRIMGLRLGRFKFRFVGQYGDRWQWTKQPMGELAHTIDSIIDAGLAKHKESLRSYLPSQKPN